MRKAGSSTVYDYFRRALDLHNDVRQFESGNSSILPEIVLDSMEYEGFNANCVLGDQPFLSKQKGAFLVTHFREPVSRQNSEYWFKGPGSKHKLANESLWGDWMDEGRPLPKLGTRRFNGQKGAKYNAGMYFDNYFTRMLSKRCGQCGLGPGGKIKSRVSAKGRGAVQGCSANTDAWPFSAVGRADLEVAKNVLARFDMILLMEWFEVPEVNGWLRKTVARSLDLDHSLTPASILRDVEKLSLGWARKNTVVPHADTKNEHKPAVEHRSSPPPKILERLKRENVLDLELYKFAKTLAFERIEAEGSTVLAHGARPNKSKERSNDLFGS
jgi:hypothetical protein